MLKWLFGEPVPSISPQDAAEHQKAGAVIIDVREKSEWSAGHIPGARHIPLGKLASSMGTLPRDREIIVICQSGMRSKSAAQQLQKAGFDNVKNLSGGMTIWRVHQLPVSR